MGPSTLRVLALAPYPEEAPSTRVRLSQYREALAARGVGVEVSTFLAQASYRTVRAGAWGDRGGPLVEALTRMQRVLRSASDYDVVWVQRGVAPFLDRWALDALRRADVPLVYDFDDAVYLPQAGGRAWVERLRDPRGVTVAFCAGASAVLAGNEHLAGFAREAAGEGRGGIVRVVPSVVDTDRLTPRGGDEAGSPVVGWVGSDSTLAYLETIRNDLRELSASGACRILVVAGSRRPALAGVDLTYRPWTPDGEADLFRSLDVGLYPLDDTPWSRGKCGYKALQYLACGVPCVASPVGVLRDIVRPGETGVLADEPGSWAPAVRSLIGDREGRRRMGANGRTMVEERYSLKAFTPVVEQVLRGVAEGGTSW